MIFDYNSANLDAWKTEMHVYQKNKRTKKPFGQSVTPIPRVTYEQVKQKQTTYNPILQVYTRQQDELKDAFTFQQKRSKSLASHFKNTIKYQKDFDIINLQSSDPFVEKIPARKLGPIRNAFNVINNQKMPEFYFQNRQVKLPIERQKKILGPGPKQYDILTNKYRKANEQRSQEETKQKEVQLKNKYIKTHDYDPVFGKYYDQQKEEEYQKQRELFQKLHGLDEEKKLPPSYVLREPFIIDYTKPLPETVQKLDEQHAKSKKRFKVKYLVLDEYQKRNEEDDQKHETIVKNHVHYGRVLDQKAKQFDIVNNRPYKQTRAEQLFNKKLEVNSWDQLIKQAAKGYATKKQIKTGGFM